MSEEKKGIKELLEIFGSLEELASFAGAVLKDGKIGADDLTHLVSLAVKFDKISAGFVGLDEAKKEAKDLDQAEVVQLLGAGYSVVAAFENAKK